MSKINRNDLKDKYVKVFTKLYEAIDDKDSVAETRDYKLFFDQCEKLGILDDIVASEEEKIVDIKNKHFEVVFSKDAKKNNKIANGG